MAKRTDVYYWSQSLTYKTLAGGNFTRGYYIKVGASGSARITNVNTTTKILAVNGVANSSDFINNATITEYSDSGLTVATGVTAVEDGSFTSSWVGPEANQAKVRIDDSFMQPKFAEITIADYDNSIQNIGIYSAYKRVKIVENVCDKPIFFGRIEFFNVQNEAGGTCLVLQCKDYLQELQESIIGHDFSGPVTLGALIKDIIDYHVFTKITYSGLAGGSFTVAEHATAGNWIRVGTTPKFGYARLIYDDITPKTLAITDVLNSEYFENGAAIAEYSNEDCTTATGVTATQSGDLTHSIDTSSISAVGTISADTAANYLKSSKSPLETITSLCLNAASDGIFSFCLEEGSATSLYPPVFKLYLRETRPSVTPSADGLTIKFNGTNGDQQREMQVDFSFPVPDKELYTEVKAFATDDDNAQLSSVKKAGQLALNLEIYKTRTYQTTDHSTQAGLNTSVDNLMSVTGNIVQRADVTFVYYPYFYKAAAYTVVRSGDLVYIHNSRISYAASGINMVVIKIEYEEPTGTTKMSLKELLYGIGCPEYTYPNTQVGTDFPESIDTRIPDMAMAPWNDILPQSIQGYQHNITFEPNAASEPYRKILMTAGTITFYDGTTQAIDWIDSHGTSVYTLSTTGSPYPTTYFYFNIDSSRTDDQKTTVCAGTNAQYTADLITYPGQIGLLCISRANATTTAYASVIPSYGKEPLITCDMISMDSLRKFNYTSTDGYTSYLYSLKTTEVTSGIIQLTSTTGKVSGANGTSPWYNQSGIVLHTDWGISLYGGVGTIALRTFADVATYNAYVTAGNPASTTGVQCYVGTDGKIYAGAGKVSLSATGIETIGEYAVWSVVAGTAVGIIKAVNDATDYFLIGTKNNSPMHIAATGSTITFDNNIDFSSVTATGSITGNCGGNCAGYAANVYVASTTSTSLYVTLVDGDTGSQALLTDSGLWYNASTNALTTTTFVGALTGNCSGSSGSCTGNAATASSCSGNSSTATISTRVVVSDSTATTNYIAMFQSATGSLDTYTDDSLYYNASTGRLYATSFAGDLTGTVTGNCSGSSGSCTGNADTATTATNLNGGSVSCTSLTAAGDACPGASSTYDLGTPSKRWLLGYINELILSNGLSSNEEGGMILVLSSTSEIHIYSGGSWRTNT